MPVAPPPKSSNAMKWVLGCGLGCLVIIILIAVAIGLGGYLLVNKGMPKAAQAAYQQLQQEGKVPAEHKAAFDRLLELGAGEKATFSSATLVLGVESRILSDGQVSEPELVGLNDAIAALEANPNFGPQQLNEYTQKHPEFSLQGGFPTAPVTTVSPAEEPAPPPVPAETPTAPAQ
jgi:hypothetical protein